MTGSDFQQVDEIWPPSKIGYAFHDVDKNGIPELIIYMTLYGGNHWNANVIGFDSEIGLQVLLKSRAHSCRYSDDHFYLEEIFGHGGPGGIYLYYSPLALPVSQL